MNKKLAAALASFSLGACALIAHHPQKLSDGSYQTACDAPLSSCLQEFETLCEWHGYDVISASEKRSRPDIRDVPNVVIHSEAKVRCKPGEPLFGRSPPPPDVPPPPALAPSPALPPPALAPPPALPTPATVEPPAPPNPVPPPNTGIPNGPESQEDPCRGGLNGDRSAVCRELRPLSARAPAVTGPAVTSTRGTRASDPRAPFDRGGRGGIAASALIR